MTRDFQVNRAKRALGQRAEKQKAGRNARAEVSSGEERDQIGVLTWARADKIVKDETLSAHKTNFS